MGVVFIAGPGERAGPSEAGAPAELGKEREGRVAGEPTTGAGAEFAGTCTIAPHCGQAARFPAALAATLSVRWQLVQENSIEPVG